MIGLGYDKNTWCERIHSVQSSIVSYTIHHEEIQCQVVVYQSTIITNNAGKGVSSAIAASISGRSSLLPVDDFQSRFLQLVKSDLKQKDNFEANRHCNNPILDAHV